MNPSSHTPEGEPHCCPVCGNLAVLEVSTPTRDASCPNCGCLLWFTESTGREAVFGFQRLLVSDPAITTKQQLIAEILGRLVACGTLEREHQAGALAAILKREELGSTGIGRGIAMPHTKYVGLKNMAGAFVKVPNGIDFESLDGQPVRLLCLLVSPAERPGDHLRVLEYIARRLRDVGFDPWDV